MLCSSIGSLGPRSTIEVPTFMSPDHTPRTHVVAEPSEIASSASGERGPEAAGRDASTTALAAGRSSLRRGATVGSRELRSSGAGRRPTSTPIGVPLPGKRVEGRVRDPMRQRGRSVRPPQPAVFPYRGEERIPAAARPRRGRLPVASFPLPGMTVPGSTTFGRGRSRVMGGFDGGRAYELVREQCALGPRVAGSPGNARCRELIAASLGSSGLAGRDGRFHVLPRAVLQPAVAAFAGEPGDPAGGALRHPTPGRPRAPLVAEASESPRRQRRGERRGGPAGAGAGPLASPAGGLARLLRRRGPRAVGRDGRSASARGAWPRRCIQPRRPWSSRTWSGEQGRDSSSSAPPICRSRRRSGSSERARASPTPSWPRSGTQSWTTTRRSCSAASPRWTSSTLTIPTGTASPTRRSTLARSPWSASARARSSGAKRCLAWRRRNGVDQASTTRTSKPAEAQPASFPSSPGAGVRKS